MEDWYKAQKLRKFARELEEYTGGIGDEGTKELLAIYIDLINEEAEESDPVGSILDEIEAIGDNELTVPYDEGIELDDGDVD